MWALFSSSRKSGSGATVRARSADAFEKPLIQPNYLAEEEDRRLTVCAMKLARRLMHTEPMKIQASE